MESGLGQVHRLVTWVQVQVHLKCSSTSEITSTGFCEMYLGTTQVHCKYTYVQYTYVQLPSIKYKYNSMMELYMQYVHWYFWMRSPGAPQPTTLPPRKSFSELCMQIEIKSIKLIGYVDMFNISYSVNNFLLL